MYPQGVCRIRKPASAGNGCAIFPIFHPAVWEQKARCPAAGDLLRGSLENLPTKKLLQESFPCSSLSLHANCMSKQIKNK